MTTQTFSNILPKRPTADLLIQRIACDPLRARSISGKILLSICLLLPFGGFIRPQHLFPSTLCLQQRPINPAQGAFKAKNPKAATGTGGNSCGPSKGLNSAERFCFFFHLKRIMSTLIILFLHYLKRFNSGTVLKCFSRFELLSLLARPLTELQAALKPQTCLTEGGPFSHISK